MSVTQELLELLKPEGLNGGDISGYTTYAIHELMRDYRKQEVGMALGRLAKEGLLEKRTEKQIRVSKWRCTPEGSKFNLEKLSQPEQLVLKELRRGPDSFDMLWYRDLTGKLKRAQIAWALGRLKKKGLVQVKREVFTNTSWHLTPQGRATFQTPKISN